jgi:general secretion pathway protein K
MAERARPPGSSGPRGRPGGQHGVALITVLLVVALVTAAAADMTGQQQLDVRRTGNRLALAQAHRIALGGEAWATAVLARDRRGQGSQGEEGALAVDSHNEDWARVLPPMPIEGGQVAGRISDAQARFNVNALVVGDRVNAVALARFERLLSVVDVDPKVAAAVVDWMDSDGEPSRPQGAEDGFYAALDHPYRSANAPLATASELRLVRGIDSEAWRALAPHVTALPQATPVNVNTAGATVLRAIVPGLGEQAAEELAEQTDREPYTTVDAFLAEPRIAQAAGAGEIPPGALATGSRHFRVRTDVQMGSLDYTLYTWLARDDNGAARVLRRSRTPN